MKTLFPAKGKFDHGPTMGGESENQKFEGTYKYTLHLYNSLFGQPPPEIWEDLQQRFNPKWTAYFNIDLGRFINYMKTVEDLSADLGPDSINPVVDIMYGQNDKTANKTVLEEYKKNCIKYGASFSYGGPFIVPVQRDEIYMHSHFYQITGNNLDVAELEHWKRKYDQEKLDKQKEVERNERKRREVERRNRKKQVDEYGGDYGHGGHDGLIYFCYFGYDDGYYDAAGDANDFGGAASCGGGGCAADGNGCNGGCGADGGGCGGDGGGCGGGGCGGCGGGGG